MAAPGPPCACTNIALMQLFHELKQQFPSVPDYVVSNAISAHCHDRGACRRRLEGAAAALAAHPAARRPRLSSAPAIASLAEAASPSSSHTPYEEEEHTCSRAAPPPPSPTIARRPNSLKLEERPNLTEKERRPSPDKKETCPFNVSLNLRYSMNVNPGAASLDLTVVTPTHSFPAEDSPKSLQMDEPRPAGFEGNFHITLSASPDSELPSRRPSALDIAEDVSSASDNLIKRQKLHLERLERALKAERLQLATMRREIRFLQANPPPSPLTARLRYTVHQLHLHCQRLTQQLEDAPSSSGGAVNDVSAHSRVPTDGERQTLETDKQSWKCHICTYINQPNVNQCEMCKMPRIILVQSDDEITIHLHPGYNRISRTWMI